MAQRKGISIGSTNQRGIEEEGKLRFNTTTGLLEYYDGTSWQGLAGPTTVTSVSPTNVIHLLLQEQILLDQLQY